MSMDTIPLRDATRAFRAEVLEAARKLQPIGGEAKLGFHIFAAEASLGGSCKSADERTQKVKLL
jgi:hypothetical protein